MTAHRIAIIYENLRRGGRKRAEAAAADTQDTAHDSARAQPTRRRRRDHAQRVRRARLHPEDRRGRLVEPERLPGGVVPTPAAPVRLLGHLLPPRAARLAGALAHLDEVPLLRRSAALDSRSAGALLARGRRRRAGGGGEGSGRGQAWRTEPSGPPAISGNLGQSRAISGNLSGNRRALNESNRSASKSTSAGRGRARWQRRPELLRQKHLRPPLLPTNKTPISAGIRASRWGIMSSRGCPTGQASCRWTQPRCRTSYSRANAVRATTSQLFSEAEHGASRKLTLSGPSGIVSF